MSDELDKLRESIKRSKAVIEATKVVAEEIAKIPVGELITEKEERIQTEEPVQSE